MMKKIFVLILAILFVGVSVAAMDFHDYYGKYVDVIYVKKLPGESSRLVSLQFARRNVNAMSVDKIYCVIITDLSGRNYDPQALYCYQKLPSGHVAGVEALRSIHADIIVLGSDYTRGWDLDREKKIYYFIMRSVLNNVADIIPVR